MIFQGELKLKSVQEVARETRLFLFEIKSLALLDGQPQPLKNFTFRAGQFLSLQFTETAWRAYSIASAGCEKEISFVVRRVKEGTASRVWWEAKQGQVFQFKGPFGEFKLSDHANAELIFCGTGTGIAPLRSMILTEMKSKAPRHMTLFYGGRDREDLAYVAEVESWAKNVKIKLGFSREAEKKKLGKFGAHCRITQFLEEENFDENAEFYICGNGDMVKSVAQILKEKNISHGKIFMERFN